MLSRPEIASGTLEAYQDFEELLRSLDDEQWKAPTRCEGWEVRDVAGHVVGLISAIAAGQLEGLGTPEVTQAHVEARRTLAPRDAAEELASSTKAAAELLTVFDDAAWQGPAPAGNSGTLGRAVEALWYDTYVHNEDIRAAIGAPRLGGAGVAVSVSHLADVLTDQKWANATLALDGVPEEQIGDGSGRVITGDPYDFIMVATGRSDPATLGLDETVNVYRDA